MNSKPDKYVVTWLTSGCLLIFCMVVIGGITRLTGSGLSITEWKPIMGAIPPLNEAQWQEAFEKYKQIPQFQKLNYHFTLTEFKQIFFWEYLHRLIGRLIGIVFLVPFFYFLVKKKLDSVLVRKVLFLFFLGAVQGFLGWFMVKSGLTERTSVSHIRLAIHLLAAFITFGFTFWLILDLSAKDSNGSPRNLPLARLLMGLVMLQLVYGAFTAGLHAGHVANTFPTMNGEWIPSGITSMEPGWKNFTDNLLTVQFMHRCIAYLLLIISAILVWKIRNENRNSSAAHGAVFFLCVILIQAVLGICTLLNGVPIALAVLHQAWAFVVFAAAVYTLHRCRPVVNPV